MLHCDGKRRLSRALALIVAKAMRRRYDEPLVAYRCRGLWLLARREQTVTRSQRLIHWTGAAVATVFSVLGLHRVAEAICTATASALAWSMVREARKR